MQLVFKPQKYLTLNLKRVTSRSILLQNFIIILLNMFFVTCIIVQILPSSESYNFFALYAFIAFIFTPFYLIINFIISLLYLLVMIFFHPTLKISRFFVVILTYNTLIFFSNSVGINLIFMFENSIVMVIVFLITFITVVWASRIMFLGLVNFVGYSKKASLNFCIVLFLFNLISFGGGFLVNV
ncbi:hypothetical protein Saga11_04620 [Bacillus safensis]|nr:hypothetical protein Saga11_04620 [Bacillus safensis]